MRSWFPWSLFFPYHIRSQNIFHRERKLKPISGINSIHASIEKSCFQENVSGQNIHFFISIFLFLLEKCWAIFSLLCGSYSRKLKTRIVFTLQLLLLTRDQSEHWRRSQKPDSNIQHEGNTDREKRKGAHTSPSGSASWPLGDAQYTSASAYFPRMLSKISVLCSSRVSLSRIRFIFNKSLVKS